MKIEIGTYEAKTKLPELLREVKRGKSFTITNRGEAIADLVPSVDEKRNKRAEAVKGLREMMESAPRVRVNIKALIEEGRD